MNEDDAKKLFSDHWERVKDDYKCCRIKAVIYTQEEKPQLGSFFLMFLYDEEDAQKILEYDSVILFDKVFPVEVGYSIAKHICFSRETPLKLDKYEFEIKGRNVWPKPMNSRNNEFRYNSRGMGRLFGIEWPGLEMEDTTFFEQVHEPDDNRVPLFLKQDLPFFSSLEKAVISWYDIHDPFGWSEWERKMRRGLLIFMPIFKLKISEISIETRRVDVELALKFASFPANLLCKFEYSTSKGYVTNECVIHDSQFSISLEDDIDHIGIYIIDKDTYELLDWYVFDANYFREDANVEYKVDTETFKHHIRKGEGKRVEFKQQYPTGDKEFLETVSAFANTEGGIIFFGITDNGEIVGVHPADLEERIINVISNKLDPVLEPTMERFEEEGKELLAVIIEEGKNKPYFVKDQGPYIRIGSTDKRMNRSEFDELYQSRRGSDY